MRKLYKLLIVSGLLLIFADLTEISAKDKKKSLEDRISLIETRLQQTIDAINGPISNSIQLMDERTLDLNNRLHKFELSQEDDKATRVREDPDKSYALTCENLDDLSSCTINFR